MPFRLLAKQAVATVTIDMSSTNITTAAWATILASLPQACSAMEIYNGSGSTMQISQGTAGHETDAGSLIPYTILPGGSSILLPINLRVLSKISCKAVDSNATTGRFTLNFFG